MFRHCFLHYKWFGTEDDLKRCSGAQKKQLDGFLTRFLEIGRFMKLQPELQAWCKKVNVKPHQIEKGDVTRINSWPIFIITLADLARRMTEQS